MPHPPRVETQNHPSERAEDLHQTEQRLQLMIEAVKDYGIFMLDPAGRIRSWNKGAQRIKGYKADEIIGRHFSVFYPPESKASGLPDRALKVADEEGRFEDEGWRVRKDGSLFWANVIITALKDDAGELVGFTKVTRDLTERREHEQALRRSEERFQQMIAAVADYGIFVLDAKGNVASWNEGAERIQGYTAGEIIGRHFSVFYPGEAREANWPEYELSVAVRDGRFEDEGWRVRKDGTLLWANVVITALRNDDDEVVGFTKVTRDLTERRAHEEALRESERRLALANRDLSLRNRELQDFARVASHDLQEPLRKISAFSQLLEEDYRDALTDEGSMYLERIRNSAQRMSVLINELLNYSRLAAPTGRVRKVDLNRIVDDVVGDLHVRIDETKGRVERGTLPSVEGDPTQMGQLFQNLIGNALKFHRPGVPPVVTISSSPLTEGSDIVGDDGFEITVSDNGIGFEEKYIAAIFTPFQRVHTRRSYEGTGLGLAICQRIVERHQGTISAESTPGEGSTFIIRLPANLLPEEDPE